uniref:AAA+ ATPase domain-containing protein n=1 Tax=viral metagenome TaxID=1070528 RepID=A0A6C0B309_9ZZZZ
MKLLALLGFLTSVAAFFPTFFKAIREPGHALFMKNYPYSRSYYENYLRRLNSKNITIQNQEIMGTNENGTEQSHFFDDLAELYANQNISRPPGGFRIIINPGGMIPGLGLKYNEQDDDDNDNDNNKFYGSNSRNTKKKSDNFEVIDKSPISFKDIGGYDNIKQELNQCIDILSNYTKYQGYNIRIPKGLIFEGPPGNGKTLFAKALAGEAGVSFIAVSGSEFLEKYVGVGSSRIRELFRLAKDNLPCIIFVDEIDAVGRRRSTDAETANTERDSTLNELLVGLDGFKNTSGIFLIGATNRADLLDPALMRPGRVDKRIFIGNPDEKTRAAIFNIHSRGKPMANINIEELVENTAGFSAAQIENLLNEAMLNALRLNRNSMNNEDIELVLNKMMVGWQPNEHEFTDSIIDHIAIHELGHAVVGLLCKHHSPVTKILINLQAPNSPGYTVFANNKSPIMTREALFEHLMILLSGRIAEEVFYGRSITTGAINDFEEALKLAQKMILYYGMGKHAVYPDMSEKYKEMVDVEVASLIDEAYHYAEFLVRNSRDLIQEGADILKKEKLVKAEELIQLMNDKYQSIAALKLREI